MNTAVDFQNISKQYTIGSSGGELLRESIVSMFLPTKSRRKKSNYKIWALKDVTFQVAKGSTLGIIGPNGAGKSTILKLLCGVTRPTTGNIHIDGKIAALIEIGAGFHPELTGRENIYLNGSILGLKKREIDAKLGDIVSFAELENFLDTPIKKYSSGMYVRLGFAVAININPDILLVDEVLAVGDLSFQHKCLKKIQEFSSMGKTIILVSHNVRNIQMICQHALFLYKGEIKDYGDSKKVVGNYINFMMNLEHQKHHEGQLHTSSSPQKQASIEQVVLINSEGKDTNIFSMGEPMRIKIVATSKHLLTHPDFGITVWTEDDKKIATCNTKFDAFTCKDLEGKIQIECVFESIPFLPGNYFLRIGIYDGFSGLAYDVWGWEKKSIPFIIQSSSDGTKISPYGELGIIVLPHRWHQH